MTTNLKRDSKFWPSWVEGDHKYMHYFDTYDNEVYTRYNWQTGGSNVYHKNDGPAVFRKDGSQEYWLDGERWDKERFDAIESWVLNSKY